MQGGGDVSDAIFSLFLLFEWLNSSQGHLSDNTVAERGNVTLIFSQYSSGIFSMKAVCTADVKTNGVRYADWVTRVHMI